jgi:hypothetical protein
MNVKSFAVRTGVAIGLTAATVVLAPATTALAKPANCSGHLYPTDSSGYTEYDATCSGGTGGFRAYMDCHKGSGYTPRQGPWENTNNPSSGNIVYSVVHCLPGETPGTHFAQLR